MSTLKTSSSKNTEVEVDVQKSEFITVWSTEMSSVPSVLSADCRDRPNLCFHPHWQTFLSLCSLWEESKHGLFDFLYILSQLLCSALNNSLKRTSLQKKTLETCVCMCRPGLHFLPLLEWSGSLWQSKAVNRWMEERFSGLREVLRFRSLAS